eukprot:8510469-Lingulodinium_polyedra.AAC.1
MDAAGGPDLGHPAGCQLRDRGGLGGPHGVGARRQRSPPAGPQLPLREIPWGSPGIEPAPGDRGIQ